MRSTRRFTCILAVLAIAACADTPTAPDNGRDPFFSILDGSTSDAAAHFFFLPPMVKQPTYTGAFDGSQEPVVTVCNLTTDAACAAPVASFTRASGITVDAVDEHYHANWKTPSDANAAHTYRISVTVQDITVGHADVKLARRASELKNIDASQYVALVAGQTLPIKFRLEEGVVTCQEQLTISGNNLQLDLRAGIIPPNEIGGNAGVFKGVSVLFAGGMVFGTSAGDYVLGYDPASGGSDFDTNTPICLMQTPTLVYSRAVPSVLHANAPSVSVVQESYAYQNAPNDDYVILRYTFTNTGGSTVSDLRVGLMLDWDLFFRNVSADYANDIVNFLPALGAGYIGETMANLGVAGMASTVPLTSYRGFNNGMEGPFNQPLVRRQNLWNFFSGGIVTTPFGPADVRQTGGVGPVSLAPGASQTFTFIISGGDNLADFEANVAQARLKAAQIN